MNKKRAPSSISKAAKFPKALALEIDKIQQTGDAQAYIQALQTAIASYPQKTSLRQTLLQQLLEVQRPRELLDAAQQALDAAAIDSNEVWNYIALAHLLLEQIEQAAEAYARVSPKSKFYQVSWLNRVRISLRQQKIEKAKRELEEFVHLTNETNAAAVMALAEAAGSQKTMDRVQKLQNNHHKPKLASIEQQMSMVPSLIKQERFLEAEAILKQLIEQQPQNANFKSDLGYTYYRLHDYAKAEVQFKNVLAINPDLIVAYQNLCAIYSLTGQNTEGERCALEGLKRAPNHTQLLHNLAIILANRRDFAESEKYYLRVLENDPKGTAYWMNYGNMLKDSDRPYEAEKAYKQALALDPKSAATWNNLGSALGMQGLQDEAMDAFRRAYALDPHYQTAINNILFTSTHHDAISPQEIAAEHRQLGAVLSTLHRKPEWRPGNVKDPNRRLKVGIVSADFRHHVVTQIFARIWEEFDRNQFEWHLYFNHHVEDHESQEYAKRAHSWHNVVGLNDYDLRQLIVGQQIDILIDLGGHTSGNRLQMMSLRAAPIQISWLGHPHTTGIPEIDYFMGDIELIPPGLNETLFTEKLIRLPSSYSFQVFGGEANTSALPAGSNGFITFGSFNRPNKIGNASLNLWARVMQALPQSRFKLGPINDVKLQARIAEKFALAGVEASRLEFFGRMPYDQYMKKHHEIDFLLDTFPFTGCGTTINALWQGVPILTLAGQSSLQRQGAMFMRKLGLPDWAPETEQAFVDQAIKLSQNIDHLAQIRASMRTRFEQSDLMAPQKTAAYVGYALREAWKRWCADAELIHIDVPRELPVSVQTYGAGTNIKAWFDQRLWSEVVQLGFPLFSSKSLSSTDTAYLGVALFEQKQFAEAIPVLTVAATELANDAYLWNVLGICHTRLGRHREACEKYLRAVQLHPEDRSKTQNLVSAYLDSQQYQSAISHLTRLLESSPNDKQWLKLLAAAAARNFDWDLAKITHQKLIEMVAPEEKEAYILDYVAALLSARDWQGAQQQLNQSLIRESKSALAWYYKGLFFHHGQRSKDAIQCLNEAVRIEPDHAKFHEMLAVEHSRNRDSALAIHHYQQALKLQPNNPETWRNYGWLLEAIGRAKEAIEANYRALELQPHFPSVIDNLLFALTKCDHLSPEFVANEHRRLGALQENYLQAKPLSVGTRQPSNNKLKIGFVSADFHEHVAMKLFAPVLEALSHENFDLYIYSNDKNNDAMTDRIRRASHVWRDITVLSDAAAAQLVFDDGIDVLFDLSGRTNGNRLGLFQYRPASIQVSWLGNPYSTGLSCIDYYFADQYLISDNGQQFFTEKLVSLPCAYAFEPASDAQVEPNPPYLSRGFITFGSFNRLNKIGERTIKLWQSVLSAVPNAHMMIGPVQNDELKQFVQSQFNAETQARLHFVPWLNTKAYQEIYREVDVILDAIPFSGGGTSLNGLWQGVPLITLSGDTPQQRQGEVYLQHLKLSEWIAHTPEEYVAKAVEVARNPGLLLELRKDLRNRFASSPLLKPKEVARDLALAIRELVR